MKSIDLRKELKHLYSPAVKQAQMVELPPFNFLMIDGAIEPGHGPGDSEQFEFNNAALYGLAYTLKFMFKQRAEDPIDYPVMALEGLWWVEDGSFQIDRKDNWRYTLMILQPDFVTPELFQEGLAKLRKKRGDQPGLADLRLERFAEGPCVQIMHLGPYATEMETIAKLDAFAAAQGYQMHGKHHEIYMGDPRKTAPDKLKTILRHPVIK
jgi:hypothetical protein